MRNIQKAPISVNNVKHLKICGNILTEPRNWLLAIFAITVLAVNMRIASAQVNTGTLVIINYVGAEMIITLDATDYRVLGTDSAPTGGVLTLQLPAKQYDYSALIPGQMGSHGTLTVRSGETETVGARIERSPAVISSEGVVKEAPRDTLVFFNATLTAPEPTATPESTQPILAPIPDGQGAVVLLNYIGETLSIDMAGTLYSVPANGQLQLNLSPGEVRYSASTTRSGMNASVRIETGTYVGIGFTREFDTGAADFEPGKRAPTPVPLAMSAFPVALDPVSAISAITEASPTPTTSVPPLTLDVVPALASETQPRLVVVNHIGEPLTFTIDDTVYTIAPNEEQAVNIRSGEFTYTASTPSRSTNGEIFLTATKTVRLSTTIDFQSGQVAVYIE